MESAPGDVVQHSLTFRQQLKIFTGERGREGEEREKFSFDFHPYHQLPIAGMVVSLGQVNRLVCLYVWVAAMLFRVECVHEGK